MPDNNMALVLQLLLDERAKNKTVAGIKEVSKAVTSSGDELDEMNRRMLEQVQSDNKKFEEAEKQATKNAGGAGHFERIAKAQAENAKKLAAQNATRDQKNLEQRKKREAEALLIEQAAIREQVQIADERRKIEDEEIARSDLKKKQSAETLEIRKELAKKEWDYEFAQKQKKEKAEEEADRKDKERVERRRARRVAEAKEVDAFEKRRAQIRANYTREVREIGRLTRTAASLGRAGQGLALTGAAVTGGLFALAQRESTRQKGVEDGGGAKVSEVTRKWLEANKRIELSTQRVAQVAQKIILPYLEKAAALAERASKYIESNPDVMKALLTAGASAFIIGQALLMASKGIRIIADLKYLAANAEFDLATRRFEKSVAAYVMAGGKGDVSGMLGKGALAAGGTGLVASVIGILTAVAGGGVLGTLVYDSIAKAAPKLGLPRFGAVAAGGAALAGGVAEKVAVGAGMDEAEAKRKTLVFTYLVGRAFGAIEEGNPAWEGVVKGARNAAGALDNLGQSAEDVAKEADGWAVLRELERDNLEATRQLEADRARVIEDANRSIGDSLRRYVQVAGSIKANLGKSIASISTDFRRVNIEAENQYQTERSKIVQQGGEEIKRIEQDTQEQLRKLAEDHATQVNGLVAARDALGLVKAERDYERNRRDIENSKNKEIAQRRRDLSIQLADLAQSHAQQRAERIAQYNQALIDARTSAQTQLKEAAQARSQEIADISRNRALALADLSKQYNEERRRRVQGALTTIQDIGAGLGAERALRQKYYGVIISDANAFMLAFQRSLALSKTSSKPKSGKSTKVGWWETLTGTQAAGGYAEKDGVYRRGEEGREFVLNHATTRAMESLVGGRLTQASILRGGGGGGTITVNDQRRFDSRVTAQDRREIIAASTAETKDMISAIIARRP